MNRLCDKCSYQNECFDENRCPFTITAEEADKDSLSSEKTIINYEYLKSLKFNDMVEFLAAGLHVSADKIAEWLATSMD